MTVADLIRELQAMPNQAAEVKILQGRVWLCLPSGQWIPNEQDLTDAAPARDVRNQGQFVTVESD